MATVSYDEFWHYITADMKFVKAFDVQYHTIGVQADPRPILDKLGYDCVLKGARALGLNHDSGGWNACFLALAYGEPGDLERQHASTQNFANALGLTYDELCTITNHYDCDRKGFAKIVTEWLLAHDPINSIPPCQTTTHSETTTPEAPTPSAKVALVHGSTTERAWAHLYLVPPNHTSTSPPTAHFTSR